MIDASQRVDGNKKIEEMGCIEGKNPVVLPKEEQAADQNARKDHSAPHQKLYANGGFFF
jgi:hypothetical protein